MITGGRSAAVRGERRSTEEQRVRDDEIDRPVVDLPADHVPLRGHRFDDALHAGVDLSRSLHDRRKALEHVRHRDLGRRMEPHVEVGVPLPGGRRGDDGDAVAAGEERLRDGDEMPRGTHLRGCDEQDRGHPARVGTRCADERADTRPGFQMRGEAWIRARDHECRSRSASCPALATRRGPTVGAGPTLTAPSVRCSDGGDWMSDSDLSFPDPPRVELDRRLSDLVEAANEVLATQGRLRALLRANQTITAQLDLDSVLRSDRRRGPAADRRPLRGARRDRRARRSRAVHPRRAWTRTTCARIGHLPTRRGAPRRADPRSAARSASPTSRRIRAPSGSPRATRRCGTSSVSRSPCAASSTATSTSPARPSGEFAEEDEQLVRSLAATAGLRGRERAALPGDPAAPGVGRRVRRDHRAAARPRRRTTRCR